MPWMYSNIGHHQTTVSSQGTPLSNFNGRSGISTSVVFSDSSNTQSVFSPSSVVNHGFLSDSHSLSNTSGNMSGFMSESMNDIFRTNGSQISLSQDHHSDQPMLDPVIWYMTEPAPDFSLTHPTTPKRRRTSTGSVALVNPCLTSTHSSCSSGNCTGSAVHLNPSVSAVITSPLQVVSAGWRDESNNLSPYFTEQMSHQQSKRNLSHAIAVISTSHSPPYWAPPPVVSSANIRKYSVQFSRLPGRLRQRNLSRRGPNVHPSALFNRIPRRHPHNSRFRQLFGSNSGRVFRTGEQPTVVLPTSSQLSSAFEPAVHIITRRAPKSPSNLNVPAMNHEIRRQYPLRPHCNNIPRSACQTTNGNRSENPNNPESFARTAARVNNTSSSATCRARWIPGQPQSSVTHYPVHNQEVEQNPNSFGVSLNLPVSESNAQTEGAAVVAAAAVASAAVHAVAAAAQAVSAVVVHQHRRHSDEFNTFEHFSEPRIDHSQPTNARMASTIHTPLRGTVTCHSELLADRRNQTARSCLPTEIQSPPSSATLREPPAAHVVSFPSSSMLGLNTGEYAVASMDQSSFATSTPVAAVLHRDGPLEVAGQSLTPVPTSIYIGSSACFPVASITSRWPNARGHLLSVPTSLLGSQVSTSGFPSPSDSRGIGSAILTVPACPYQLTALSQSARPEFFSFPTGMAAALNAASVHHASVAQSAANLRVPENSTNSVINLTQTSLQRIPSVLPFLTPRFSIPSSLTSVSLLPVTQTSSLTSHASTLSTTRDIQTLFQFLRLINQRQDSYSLPYYPSAMTATAGGSNPSVVVSPSIGGTNGSRVAASVTPPLTPHHSAFPQSIVVPRNAADPISPVVHIPAPPQDATHVPPTSSAAMALAAVAMAAAAALQQQTNRQIPANVISMLAAPQAAPTPSIPVPILHAQLYYPTSIATVQPLSVSHIPPCYHSHYGTTASVHQHSTRSNFNDPSGQSDPVASSGIGSSAFLSPLFPFLLAVPSSAAHPTPDTISASLLAHYASSNPVPATPAAPIQSDPTSAATAAAAAAVAAAAAAAAASVDTLYQLAVQLESSGNLVRGLTKEELDSLPVRIFRPKGVVGLPSSDEGVHESGLSATEERCMICLDDYETDDVLRIMRCRHEFHSVCVDKWLKNKRTCPLCRADAFDGTQRKEEVL